MKMICTPCKNLKSFNAFLRSHGFMHSYKFVGMKCDNAGILRRFYYEIFDGVKKTGECTICFNCLIDEEKEV